MIKYFTIILFIFLLFVTVAFSQTGSISGIVKDSSGAPQPDVNVKIKGSYKGTATDVDGKY